MELISYIRLARKWSWLLLLGAFLAGGTSFLWRSRQPEEYKAQTTILIGSYIEAPNPDSAEIRTGVELASTYAILAETHDVLDAAIQAGSFPVSVGELSSALSADVVPDTSLLRLTVTYTNAELAADMANEVARQLIANNLINLTAEQQELMTLAQTQIEWLTPQLERDQATYNNLDLQIAELEADETADPTQVQFLKDERSRVRDETLDILNIIAQFNTTITTLQQRTNSLDIVEQAEAPGSPIGTSPFQAATLGAIVGLALAAGVALLIEYLDDTIHTPEEATQMLSLPVLASITRFGKPRDEYHERLITHHDPGSHTSEEYRTLRTNLLFSSNGSWSKGAYIITSPGPSEGKSVTAANLAVTMAAAGLRVLLVDADLRRPRLHTIFKLENNVGLSTLLFADSGEQGDMQPPHNLKDCLQETDIPGLRVITSGFIPVNPTEALGSVAMQRWFQEFRSAKNVDIVLFDTPPALYVADSSALAVAIKAPVVLVVEAGQTRRGAAVRAREQFGALELEIKGVVLNAANRRDQSYNYSYNYYYYREPEAAAVTDHAPRQG
ncbi:MAG: polysaccharide biosynthesis tyrosine autokinase [Chloroflexi bacterium]|nr:polysaccharide biosynthesis tyrosine autokinase [Chloroflexota bacterium]